MSDGSEWRTVAGDGRATVATGDRARSKPIETYSLFSVLDDVNERGRLAGLRRRAPAAHVASSASKKQQQTKQKKKPVVPTKKAQAVELQSRVLMVDGNFGGEVLTFPERRAPTRRRQQTQVQKKQTKQQRQVPKAEEPMRELWVDESRAEEAVRAACEAEGLGPDVRLEKAVEAMSEWWTGRDEGLPAESGLEWPSGEVVSQEACEVLSEWVGGSLFSDAVLEKFLTDAVSAGVQETGAPAALASRLLIAGCVASTVPEVALAALRKLRSSILRTEAVPTLAWVVAKISAGSGVIARALWLGYLLRFATQTTPDGPPRTAALACAEYIAARDSDEHSEEEEEDEEEDLPLDLLEESYAKAAALWAKAGLQPRINKVFHKLTAVSSLLGSRGCSDTCAGLFGVLLRADAAIAATDDKALTKHPAVLQAARTIVLSRAMDCMIADWEACERKLLQGGTPLSHLATLLDFIATENHHEKLGEPEKLRKLFEDAGSLLTSAVVTSPSDARSKRLLVAAVRRYRIDVLHESLPSDRAPVLTEDDDEIHREDEEEEEDGRVETTTKSKSPSRPRRRWGTCLLTTFVVTPLALSVGALALVANCCAFSSRCSTLTSLLNLPMPPC